MFTFEAERDYCDDEMLVDMLMKAASENSSVEAVCRDLSEVADKDIRSVSTAICDLLKLSVVILTRQRIVVCRNKRY